MHPGDKIRRVIALYPGMTVAHAADQLGVSRVALSRVINGAAAVSPDMALRLGRWLSKVDTRTAADWLAMQASHDLAAAARKLKLPLAKIKPAVMPPAANGGRQL